MRAKPPFANRQSSTLERTLNDRLSANEIVSLIDRHGDALTWYARQWSNHPEDCVQEAFVELAATHRPDRPSAWLFRVVRNKAINEARSSNRRRKHEEAASRLRPTRVGNSNSLQDDEHERLIEGLERLNQSSRELIVLRIWSGLTWDQISEVTQLPLGTAHRKYQRALKQLKSLLETNLVE